MNRKRKDRRTLALALLLAVGLLLPAGAWAQMIDRRGEQQNGQSYGLMQRGGNRSGEGSIFGNESFGAAGGQVGNESFGAAGGQIDNEPFGLPLGGGIGILLAAGAGYALIQSKKNKQN